MGGGRRVGTGERDQRCLTFRTMKEARAERSKIISDRSRGTLVKRTKVTLAQAIDDWLAGRRHFHPTPQRTYRDSLELVGSVMSGSMTSPRHTWTSRD